MTSPKSDLMGLRSTYLSLLSTLSHRRHRLLSYSRVHDNLRYLSSSLVLYPHPCCLVSIDFTYHSDRLYDSYQVYIVSPPAMPSREDLLRRELDTRVVHLTKGAKRAR